MPTKKKKYNARFPPARIKKIMQIDEDVGKVAAAVPVIISRALEMFVENLLKKADEVTSNRGARTLTPSHIKHCILSEPRFDFLKDLVTSVSDLRGDYDETASHSPSSNCSTPSFNKKQFFGGNNNPKTLPRQISTFKTRGRPRKVDKNCEGIIAAATINSTSTGTKIETKAKRFSNDISSNGVKKRKKRNREMKFVDCEEDDDGEEVPSSDTELQTVPNGNSSKTNGSIAQPPVVTTMSPVLGTVNHIPHQLARASAAATIRQPLNRSKSYTPVGSQSYTPVSGRSYTPVSTKCYTPVGSAPPFIVHRSELLNSGGLTFSLTYPMMPMSPALTPITGPHGLSFSGDGRSSVVKTDEKVTFTVNPVAPWSTQGGVDEDYDA